MKHTVLMIILLILLLVVMIFTMSAFEYAYADGERYVLCNPDSYVIVRRKPKKTSEETGYFECGDRIETDGLMKNNFIHCIGVTEYGEGWVYAGYIVDDKPVICDQKAKINASGRVACYRWIDGKRKRWLRNGASIAIYAYSEEWAVTNHGFVRMKYLEVQHD